MGGTVTTFTGEIHPYADAYPMLTDDELDALAESIKADGLLEPLVLTSEGALLDGRNRLAACERAGVEPRFVVYEGEQPVAYVIARNVHRRHLNTGQRAMAVAIGLVEAGKRENGRWRRGSVPDDPDSAGSRGSGWTWAVRQAGVVLDHLPDLAPAVMGGGMALDEAYKHALTVRSNAETEEERFAALREKAPDLAQLVAEERLALKEAWATWEERAREAKERRQRTADYLRRLIPDLVALHAVLNHSDGAEVWALLSRGEADEIRKLLHDVCGMTLEVPA